MTLISGDYASLFRGRGLEIESLREYVPGDEVKDIDWKATVRTNAVHTRVYTEQRDTNITVVADTSRSMLLPGYSGLGKLDALYAVIVILGTFVIRSHDELAVCGVDGHGQVQLSRYGNSGHHLEALLQSTKRFVNASLRHSLDMSALFSGCWRITRSGGWCLW